MEGFNAASAVPSSAKAGAALSAGQPNQSSIQASVTTATQSYKGGAAFGNNVLVGKGLAAKSTMAGALSQVGLPREASRQAQISAPPTSTDQRAAVNSPFTDPDIATPSAAGTEAANAGLAKVVRTGTKDSPKEARTSPGNLAPPIFSAPAEPAIEPPPPTSAGLPGNAENDSASQSVLAATVDETALVPLIEENIGGKTAPGNKTSLSEEQPAEPEDLTFAVRIQPGAASHRSAVDSVPAARRGTAESGSDETPDSPTPALGQQSAAALAQRFDIGGSRVESESPVSLQTSQPAPQPAAGTQIGTNEPAAAPKTPLTDISLQVGQSQGQNVEVRLVERAGELRVAVRAGDSDVAQGLRQGLSDLTSKLSESGFRAETWRPGDAGALSSSAANDSADTPGHSPNNGSQSQSHSGAAPQDRGQQGQNPANRPRWVQELEKTLHNGAGSKGNLNGLVS